MSLRREEQVEGVETRQGVLVCLGLTESCLVKGTV